MIIAIETDTHAGHEHGLCYPELEGPDGEKERVSLNPTQQKLWELRENNLVRLRKRVKRKKWMYIHVGDQTQGNKYWDSVAALTISRQNKIAYANMLPILRMKPDYIRIAKGTPSHEFGDGGSAEILHNYYRMKFPKLDIKTKWLGLINIDGYKIEYRHRGPGNGSRSWTKHNSCQNYVKSEWFDELKAGEIPINLYLRGHIHTRHFVTFRDWWRNKMYTSHLIISPGMCGVGVYEQSALQSLKRITVGMVVFDTEANDGEFWTETFDLRDEERI